MSRLNDVIGKIETALAELTSSLEHLTEQQSAPAIDAPAIDVNELEAMKAELGEAVRLLESVQTSTQSSDEASS